MQYLSSPARSLRYKALSGIATLRGRRVSYHQVHDLVVTSPGIKNKNIFFNAEQLMMKAL